MSDLEDYYTAAAEHRRKKLPFDDVNQEGQAELSARDQFHINKFFSVLDKLSCELQRRMEAYQLVYNRFSFFEKLTKLNTDELKTQALNLCDQYFRLGRSPG